jgi:hypothetical protein
VIAEIDEAVVGVALFRLFTNEEHGDGFIDEHTPEVAVAVAMEHRGQGSGLGSSASLRKRHGKRASSD